MKFCKNLQRVVDISDPEWAPYWPNYKMLKKLIKELPSLVPSDDAKAAAAATLVAEAEATGEAQGRGSLSRLDSSTANSYGGVQQHHGDKTAENSQESVPQAQQEHAASRAQHGHDTGGIGKSPGEIAFFKLLHSEFKKATRFFDRASEEFTIREERVREGMSIMKQPNSIMVNEKWSLMAKSIYRLYKDLLLLETFAIMTYCSFSKILKKHDKVTGYETRVAFMANIVNKANFTHYPKVLEMIQRCETLYEEVPANLLREGKEGLYEDERLFINMIHRLNEQVLSSDDSEINEKRKEGARRMPVQSKLSASENETIATSALRKLVEENEKMSGKTTKKGAQVSEGDCGDCDDDDSEDNGPEPPKIAHVAPQDTSSTAKRLRTE